MPSQSALRIRYEYDKDGVRPTSKRRVQMTVPSPTAPPPGANQAGLWCELQDKQGKLLYHWILHHALGEDAEIFSPGSDTSVHRVPGPVRGAFDVIVPDLPEGDAVALVGPQHPSGMLRRGPVRYALADIPDIP